MNCHRVAAGLAVALTLSTSLAGAAPQRRPAAALPGDRVIVKWREHGVAAMQIDSIEGRTAQLQAYSGLRLRALRNVHDKLDVLRLDHALSARALQSTVARLRLDPSVEYAEPDARRYITAFPADPPDDPRFVEGNDAIGSWRGQWYLGDGLAQDAATATPSAISATAAWTTTTGTSSIIVAVLDTGIEFDHPDLGRYADGGPVLPGRDFVSCDDGSDFCSDAANTLIANDGSGWDPDASDPGDWVDSNDLNAVSGAFDGCETGDSSWHGTRVAGIIAARTNNAAGMAAIAPGVLILPARVLGKCTGYLSDVVAAMRWAAGLSVSGVALNPYPATIINLSLGAAQPCSTSEQDAVNEIKARGVVIVASAGNDGGPVSTPANCSGVIAVAGLRHAGTKVGYSNVSSTAAAVSIAAPAGNCVNIAAGSECLYSIETASDDGKTAPGSPIYTYSAFTSDYSGNSTNVANVGTSFAAPMVSGVAALMASVNLKLTPSLLATRMLEAATRFPTPTVDENNNPIATCAVRSAATNSSGNYTDVPADPVACVCTTGTCGAGMVNAAAAVAAALRPIASFTASDGTGSVGQTITLDGSASAAATGHTIATWAWTSKPSVGIAGASRPVASFVFPALRPITVTLTVTDDAGRQDSATLTINSSTGIGSDGGGGALGAELFALTGLALARWRRRNLNGILPRLSLCYAAPSPLQEGPGRLPVTDRCRRIGLIGMVSAPLRRALGFAWILAACGLVGACSSGNSDSGLSGSVGTGSGIVISTSTGTVLVQEGATIKLTATVATDTNGAGVTWTLSGLGSLSGATAIEVTYNAPAAGTITGTSTPIITATSVADTTKSTTVALVVSGAPVIDPITLFPANADTPWGANVVVIGGESPFAWTVSSGTLPAGITLGSSTTATGSVSGTPTTTGAYNFQIKATDKQSRTATVDLTLVVNAKAACLLSGRYALLYSGFGNQNAQTRAASLVVAGDGTVTGVMDTRSASDRVEAESLTGTCTTRTANNGTLTLTGSTSGKLVFDYAVRASLTQGRVQLTSGGSTDSGSGLIARQDATAFDLAQLPLTAAFGVIGADTDGTSMGLAGSFARDASGNLTSGRADANGTPALDAAPLSGLIGAPDTAGRGTLALSAGSKSYAFVYYVVDASRLLLVNMDAAADAQRLAGFLTPQATSFDATALAAPGILSLWGAGTGIEPIAVLALGRLSNASAGAGAGTLDLRLDTANRATALADVAITGAGYTVESDGRATLGFTSAGAARSFALYLDGTANGYVVEKNSATGSAGLLEAQAAGPFANTLPGLFVLGTQYPQSLAPITLAPLLTFSGGVLSGNYVSGYYALDSATGRGVGTLSISGIGGSSMALYVVRPDRVLMLQFGTSNRDGALNWVEK